MLAPILAAAAWLAVLLWILWLCRPFPWERVAVPREIRTSRHHRPQFSNDLGMYV